jgi:RES domain-containing protein
MQVWRIFPARYRSSAFTGIGGLYAAGRWNHLGVPLVYTATSRALAALEFFVNLDPGEAPDDLLIAEASIPNDTILTLDLNRLPAHWRELNNDTCRNLGSEWVADRRSLGLLVPSAVVEDDWNLLLNPAHSSFASLHIVEPKPFHYDERMFR